MCGDLQESRAWRTEEGTLRLLPLKNFLILINSTVRNSNESLSKNLERINVSFRRIYCYF